MARWSSYSDSTSTLTRKRVSIDGGDSENHNPLTAQLADAMNLLESNLEAKSQLYKDPALCNIFMINNERFVAKVKESSKIRQVLGETSYRRRASSGRRGQGCRRACRPREGLTTHSKSGVAKPSLKERFKSFNAMVEEIHTTQSAWVVSDEQMQPELRVSVSVVVAPVYSSYFYPGTQTVK